MLDNLNRYFLEHLEILVILNIIITLGPLRLMLQDLSQDNDKLKAVMRKTGYIGILICGLGVWFRMGFSNAFESALFVWLFSLVILILLTIIAVGAKGKLKPLTDPNIRIKNSKSSSGFSSGEKSTGEVDGLPFSVYYSTDVNRDGSSFFKVNITFTLPAQTDLDIAIRPDRSEYTALIGTLTLPRIQVPELETRSVVFGKPEVKAHAFTRNALLMLDALAGLDLIIFIKNKRLKAELKIPNKADYELANQVIRACAKLAVHTTL